MSKTFPSGQTRADHLRLDAEWKASPEVRRFSAAVSVHASTLSHLTDVEAIGALNAFANAWLREHGDLPNPGIREF